MMMRESEFEILDALRKPVCVVCELCQASARNYLRGIMADGVNDATVRGEWRRRGGLCSRHWRSWRGLESPALSSAIVAQDLLASYLASGVPRRPRCRACEIQKESEKRYLAALQTLPWPKLEEGFRERGFLCLLHLEALPEGPLREAFRLRLEGILSELAAFIRKHDYRFSSERRGLEGDSWLRAIRSLGGEV